MNKRTRAIDEDTYKLIIATMKNGFVHEGVQYKPNERIATVLVGSVVSLVNFRNYLDVVIGTWHILADLYWLVCDDI